MSDEIENTEEVVETETPVVEEKKLEVELPDELKPEAKEEEITDPADKEEAGDDKDEVDPDKPATDIVYPEDTILNDEQQSEFSDIVGSQENHDKLITMLKDIGAEQAVKNEADAVATAETKSKENEATLKSDADFGKEYEANVKGVEELANELGLKEALDVKDPAIAKGLLKIVKERSDAEVHINNKKNVPTGPKKDAYGKNMMNFDKTMDALKERK